MGTYASGYMHTLRHVGYLFIGNSILCSRNTIYILMKTLTENTQKCQLQEALIWNPSGRTFRVQSSVLWWLRHGPLSGAHRCQSFSFHFYVGMPRCYPSSHCSHLNFRHGFPTILKHFHFAVLLSLGCAKQTQYFIQHFTLFNLHIYAIDAFLLLVKRVGNLVVNFNYLFSSLLESQAFYCLLYNVFKMYPFHFCCSLHLIPELLNSFLFIFLYVRLKNIHIKAKTGTTFKCNK